MGPSIAQWNSINNKKTILNRYALTATKSTAPKFRRRHPITVAFYRSRMSPKPATNSHMTGAPKLETVAVHCGKNGVKYRRFWRRLIGFIKSPLANRIYPRLYREKFEAFLRHISNFLPWTFLFLPWLFWEKKFQSSAIFGTVLFAAHRMSNFCFACIS